MTSIQNIQKIEFTGNGTVTELTGIADFNFTIPTTLVEVSIIRRMKLHQDIGSVCITGTFSTIEEDVIHDILFKEKYSITGSPIDPITYRRNVIERMLIHSYNEKKGIVIHEFDMVDIDSFSLLDLHGLPSSTSPKYFVTFHASGYRRRQ